MPRFDPKTWACVLCEATLIGTAVCRARTDKKICDWCERELARTNRKRCRNCSVPHALTAFSPCPTRPDGHRYYCRACETARQRLKRQADPETAAIINRRYHQAHHAQRQVWQRAYNAGPRKMRQWLQSAVGE